MSDPEVFVLSCPNCELVWQTGLAPSQWRVPAHRTAGGMPKCPGSDGPSREALNPPELRKPPSWLWGCQLNAAGKDCWCADKGTEVTGVGSCGVTPKMAAYWDSTKEVMATVSKATKTVVPRVVPRPAEPSFIDQSFDTDFTTLPDWDGTIPCPECGTGLAVVPGKSGRMTCPGCGSQLSVESSITTSNHTTPTRKKKKR